MHEAWLRISGEQRRQWQGRTHFFAAAAEANGHVGKPVSDSVAKRLSETLRAAAVDPGSAHLLRHSILPDEVQAGGFELLAGLPMSRRASRRRPEARRAPRPKPSDDARLARLRGELDDARRALRSAQAALTSAERDVARRRKRVSELEARIERAK